MAELGKILLGIGVVMIVLGGGLLLASHFEGKGPWLGRLPGDIYVERENWRFYFPLGTSILISIVLTLLLTFLGRR
jgi:hypothetical protein